MARHCGKVFLETQYVDARVIDMPPNNNMIATGGPNVDTIAARRPQTATKLSTAPGRSRIAGFRHQQIDRLVALIERHIAEGRYPGCQIALARHGKLALHKSFGDAVTEPKPRAAGDDTLWLLYSNTKVVTAVALWALAERGLFSFSDRIATTCRSFAGTPRQHHHPADHHPSGGLSNAVVAKDAWANHKRLRDVVCDFRWNGRPVRRSTITG